MSKIEQQVMARVGLIYLGRILASVTALKLYALVGSGIGLFMLVSISDIVTNFVNVAQEGVGSVAIFAASALLGTTLFVQIALAVGAMATISLVTPVLRSSHSLA